MDTPLHDQDAHHFRQDNGSETTAAFLGLVNSDINVGPAETIGLDSNARLRIVVQETAGFADSNHRCDWQYSLNGGAWTDIDGATSLVIRAATSANYADGDHTTQQVGSGSFVTPNLGMDDGDGSSGGASPDFLGSDETEFEFCFQVRSADVSDTDTIDIKGTSKGTDYNTYTNIGRITIVDPAGADPEGPLVGGKLVAGGLLAGRLVP